jgi:peptide-O-fucosyltransferase
LSIVFDFYLILVFCYASRGDTETCNAKEGNPFGPYWDNFNVDFKYNRFHAPLLFESSDVEGWLEKYPASKYPVLAFTGVPGEFPVRPHNAHLQKYLQWSELINNEADRVLDQMKKSEIDEDEPEFIAIHMRNGQDFVK